MHELNLDKYSFTNKYYCDFPEWLMDERHVKIIHNLVMECNFKCVVEIGCYSGFSTVALIESLNKGKLFDVHLIEPYPTQKLLSALSMCKNRERILLHEKQARQALKEDRAEDFVSEIDLIIIDGDHSLGGAGANLLFCLRNNVPNIIAHDTNKDKLDKQKHPCWGAELIGHALRNHKDYMCAEDLKTRPNESTDRGLLFATVDKNNHSIARKIFDENI